LTTYETALNHVRTTKTKTGLHVKAYLVRKQYPKGEKISDEQMHLARKQYPKGEKISGEQMHNLNLTRGEILPHWNYTVRPS
jgi:hypothetical protein